MVSISGNLIVIRNFVCPYGVVEYQELDLTPFQGQLVRVFLDYDLKLVVNPKHDCYWQIAEVYLPPPKVNQQEKGVVQENVDDEIWVTRTEGDVDEIDGLGTGEIVSAGFYWCNYQKGVDFQQITNGIKWLGERRPQEGEQYPVVVRRTVEKIEYENIVEPLDLSKLNVTIFELPKEE